MSATLIARNSSRLITVIAWPFLGPDSATFHEGLQLARRVNSRQRSTSADETEKWGKVIRAANIKAE